MRHHTFQIDWQMPLLPDVSRGSITVEHGETAVAEDTRTGMPKVGCKRRDRGGGIR